MILGIADRDHSFWNICGRNNAPLIPFGTNYCINFPIWIIPNLMNKLISEGNDDITFRTPIGVKLISEDLSRPII